jgi:RHS repeat-associated protein
MRGRHMASQSPKARKLMRQRLILRKHTLHRGASRAVAHVLILAVVLSSVPVRAAAASSSKSAVPEMEEAALPPPLQSVKVNTTKPNVDPVPQTPVFSEPPQDEEFFRARVFAEPFIPFGETSVEENRAFAAAILAYHEGKDNENVAPFGLFLNRYPNSAWRASLLANLGIHYHRTGYFRRAKETLTEAWSLAQEADGGNRHVIANRALGELLDLHGKFGDVDKLEELIEESRDRELNGDVVEKASNARNAIYVLRQQHHEAIASGAMAVDRYLSQGKRGHKQHPEIARFHAKPEGASLNEVFQLTQKAGLKLELALRPAGRNDIVTPSIVHFKEGHFAALLREENGRYVLSDPILGGEEIWLTRAALLEEASGYFLVPEGRTPPGWSKPRAAEVNHVRGKCQAGIQTPGITGDAAGRCGDGCPGMAAYSFNTFLASLQITDTPVGYSPPRGPAVAFTVSYDHREAYQPAVFTFSNIGPRWSFAWLSYVEDDPNNLSGPVRAFRRGGGSEDYSGLVGDSYAPDLLTRAVVVRTSSSPITYERRLPDGSVEVFAQPDGALSPRRVFLTAVRDPRGNSLTISYDSQLRIAAVTDALNQVTTFSYELLSDPLKITKVTDPFGRSASLEYNASGALVRITDVVGIVSEMEYGSTDFIRALTTPYGTTSFSYASPYAEGTIYYADRWLEATDPQGGKERIEFRWTTSALPATDPANTVPTGFLYNDNLNKWNSYHWDKRAMALHPGDFTKARTWHWQWSAPMTMTAILHSEKQPLESRVWYGQAGESFANGAGRDGRPAKVGRVLDDGTSQISRYEYNSRGLKTRETDPLGRETVYVFGTGSTPDPDQTSGTGVDLLQVKRKNGGSYELLASYTHNGQHQPLTTTDALGKTTSYTYNTAGQVLTVTTPPAQGHSQGATTTFTYDTSGYLQQVSGPVPGATTAFTYDAYGRRRTVTDAAGLMLTYDYDALDRVTKVTYPDTTYEETVYDRLDAEKRRDRLGRWTQTFYDALRRAVATKDAAGQITQYQYGVAGCSSCSGGGERLTKLVDPNGNATSWEYDLQGRVKKETRADDSFESYAYETTSSRLEQKTDRKNVTTTFDYFLDGKLKSKTYSDSTPTTNYTYDPVDGLMLTAANGTDTLTWTYDALDRVATESSSKNASTVGYVYDDAGNRTVLSLNGATHVTYGYDQRSRLTGITRGSNTIGFGYDTASRRTTMTYPNGVVTTYGYDAESRLTSLGASLSGTPITSFSYVLDAVGNRTRKTTLDWAEDYGYDEVYRLKSADRSAGTPTRWRFAYDPAGNRTTDQTDDAAMGATFNEVNELQARQPGGVLAFRGTTNEPASVTIATKPAQTTSTNAFTAQAPVGSGTTDVAVVATDPAGNVRTNTYRVTASGAGATYTYDSNGNLNSKTEGTDTWGYEWNANNELTRVTKNSVEHARFAYDPEGRRVEKVAGGVTTGYTYAGDNILREIRGATTLKYVHGPDIDEPLAVDDGTSFSYYHADALGSVVKRTNSAGAATLSRQYDAWGNQESGASEGGCSFTGREWDPEVGLYYYRARYYDPKIGAFISEDPIGPADRALDELNAYRYVGNDPVNRLDPTGLGYQKVACEKLLAEIQRILEKVRKRIEEQQAGSRDPEVWRNHQKSIAQLMRLLESLIEQAKKHCKDFTPPTIPKPPAVCPIIILDPCLIAPEMCCNGKFTGPMSCAGGA